MSKKKRAFSWIDALTKGAKAVTESAVQSGDKAKAKRKTQKANCGGCD